MKLKKLAIPIAILYRRLKTMERQDRRKVDKHTYELSLKEIKEAIKILEKQEEVK